MHACNTLSEQIDDTAVRVPPVQFSLLRLPHKAEGNVTRTESDLAGWQLNSYTGQEAPLLQRPLCSALAHLPVLLCTSAVSVVAYVAIAGDMPFCGCGTEQKATKAA